MDITILATKDKNENLIRFFLMEASFNNNYTVKRTIAYDKYHLIKFSYYLITHHFCWPAATT